MAPRISVGSAEDVSLRGRFEILRVQLDNERTSFMGQWADLAKHILPMRIRTSITDVNRGDRRNQAIIDTTPVLAARVFQAGMMAGLTNEATKWFLLGLEDRQLQETPRVKRWLNDVRELMLGVMARSDFYGSMSNVYDDLGTFATAAMSIEEDFQRIIKTQTYENGTYWFATEPNGRANVFYQEYQLTVRQMVDEFGHTDPRNPRAIDWTKFSAHVRDDWDNERRDIRYDIVQVVMPNPNWNPDKPQAKFKRFGSWHYELGSRGRSNRQPVTDVNDGRFLRESGFDLFPFLVPRWSKRSRDDWGTNCPGMMSIGDIKQLQRGEQKGLRAIDKKVDPPLQGPTVLKTSRVSQLPGDITFVDIREGQQGLTPIFQVQFELQDLEFKQALVRSRIERAYYVDLFQQFTNLDKRNVTATEIAQRQAEKLQQVGPAVQRMSTELHSPGIDLIFQIMLRQNQIPPIPEELIGRSLKIEYQSVMAQAQKAAGLGSMDRFFSFAAQVVQASPPSMDKLDLDEALDIYAEISGVPPTIVVSDEDVAIIRAQRAAEQQRLQDAAMAAESAKTAKDLSQAEVKDDNALGQLVSAARSQEEGAPV